MKLMSQFGGELSKVSLTAQRNGEPFGSLIQPPNLLGFFDHSMQ